MLITVDKNRQTPLFPYIEASGDGFEKVSPRFGLKKGVVIDPDTERISNRKTRIVLAILKSASYRK